MSGILLFDFEGCSFIVALTPRNGRISVSIAFPQLDFSPMANPPDNEFEPKRKWRVNAGRVQHFVEQPDPNALQVVN